eukprot:TRINITY_DN257_c1_g1_i3.p2 TRINITY_DN257_c1_g1~~TRINITY_DN257_c1_g1_i3.p2  ORF type:complete len:114 (-),score=2.51 TRINITY_DN257_c1_g1_i3:398-739(-)
MHCLAQLSNSRVYQHQSGPCCWYDVAAFVTAATMLYTGAYLIRRYCTHADKSVDRLAVNGCNNCSETSTRQCSTYVGCVCVCMYKAYAMWQRSPRMSGSHPQHCSAQLMSVDV